LNDVSEEKRKVYDQIINGEIRTIIEK
jgi:hypothetical protein